MNTTTQKENDRLERISTALRNLEGSLNEQSKAIADFRAVMSKLDDRMQVLDKNMQNLSGSLGGTIARTTRQTSTPSIHVAA